MGGLAEGWSTLSQPSEKVGPAPLHETGDRRPLTAPVSAVLRRLSSDVLATGRDIRPSSTDGTRRSVCGFAISPTFGRELRLTPVRRAVREPHSHGDTAAA